MDRISMESAKILDSNERIMFIPLTRKEFDHYLEFGEIPADERGYVRAYDEVFDWYNLSMNMKSHRFVLVHSKVELLHKGFFEVEVVDKPLDAVSDYEKSEDDLYELRYLGPVTIKSESYFVIYSYPEIIQKAYHIEDGVIKPVDNIL